VPGYTVNPYDSTSCIVLTECDSVSQTYNSVNNKCSCQSIKGYIPDP